MGIIKKITAAFCAAAVAVSLSGCFAYLPRPAYWDKDGMIEYALKYRNIPWLTELLTDCTPRERAEYAFKIVDNWVEPGRLYAADAICEMGVDFDDTDYPMIAMSAKKLDYEAVKYFLEKGADPNIRDSDDYTPLYYALENASGQWEASGYYLSKLLVENGAEPYPEMFRNEYEGDPERNVGNGAYRQIAHSPMTTKFLLGILLDGGQESGLPKAVEYAILGECEKSLNELKSGNTVSDVDMGLISYYFGYFGTMEQYQEFADFWGKYAKPPASCVAGAGNVEVLKRLYLNKDPDNEESKEFVLDFRDHDLLSIALVMNQTEVVKLLLSYTSINNDWIEWSFDSAFCGDVECFKLLYDFNKKVNGEFKDEWLKHFSPDRYLSMINKYEIIDFLFDEGLDCRYVDLEFCTADTVKYLYKKGRPLMLSDLTIASTWGDHEFIKAVIEEGKANVNYGGSFDFRTSYDDTKYDGDKLLHKYQGSPETKEKYMTYEELCKVVEPNGGLTQLCLYQTPETLQYVIDQGLILPEDCLLDKFSYQYSAANVRVLLENGANTKATIDTIPDGSRELGFIKRGEFTVKEYFEACDRPDLVELLKEYE
ncbi:MAG: ankyrin repeat domain-containing protein [Oscillospiraceae bacterium]|nr:ankyrin repeat domain-containing protein [Oscillospiraceae bacterium]